MTKSSLNGSVTRKYIIENRELGKSDLEIFNELSELYFDKQTIASLIKLTPNVEQRNRYKTPNTILSVLMGLSIILELSNIISCFIASDNFFFANSFVLMNFLFIYWIFHFRTEVYAQCAVFNIFFILQYLLFFGKLHSQSWGAVFFGHPYLYFALGTLISVAIIFLSFYLMRKLGYDRLGKKLPKDEQGNYIFD